MNRRDPSGRCWWGAVIGLGVYAGTVALEGRKFNWWAADCVTVGQPQAAQ